MMAPELQGCKRGIEVSCVRSECNPATPWPFFKYGPPLRGGEPMSNHDCCALVRHAIERLPPQPFALGVERGLRLTQHQRRCVLRLRVIARRWRWPTERSLRACQPCAVFFSWRCAVKQSAVALVATCRPASSEVSGRTKANVLGYASGEDKQILRQEGEPLPEIEGIKRRADRRGEADRFEFVRASPSCHGPGFEHFENAHGAEMQTPSRSVLDAEEASVGRDRLHRPD